MSEQILIAINKKLDTIIRLLALKFIENEPIKEQIIFLYSIGLEASDIARLLGKSRSHVSKEISLYRKKLKEEEKE